MMSATTIVILEDNQGDADNLAQMLSTHFPALHVMAVLRNYQEAITRLPTLKPDILFLDVNLPGGYTGFDVLDACKPLFFNTIFTTAYDRYAVDAIRASALDYLLKPFGLRALTEALQRAIEKIRSSAIPPGYSTVSTTRENLLKEKVIIHSAGTMMILDIYDINRIEANGNYSIFVLTDGRRLTSSYTLQFHEQELNNPLFFRSHRSFLVNINHIKSLRRNSNGGLLTMKDDMEVNITKEKVIQLLAILQGDRDIS